jgi:DNA primase
MEADRAIPEEIKSRLPIEQLIASYLPLKKAGRVYKALCPFHGEKTPSFSVNPERGIFKCFGCGKGGDIFDFVMELEGLTFPEAVRLLGDKAGVVVPEFKPNGGGQPSGPGKARLFELNAVTASLWHQLLITHPKAAPALDYLHQRGLTDETIKKFQIGYAPYGPVTAQGLEKKGFSLEERAAAGDPTKFQDRIVFPVTDITGKIVGFTGRLLELPDDPRAASSRGPKYWNTPETPVFLKSKTVYALHLAKHAIQKDGLAILAEGQMDVTMLHQAGFEQAVASSGTALTVEQLRLIGRFAPALAFAYDGDTAGQTATKRGIELALEAELTPYVISMPKGKDPADLIKNSVESWETAFANRQPSIAWLLDVAAPSGTVLTPEKKRAVAEEMVGWLGRMTSLSEQDTWIPYIASRLQTDERNVRTLLKRRFPSQATPQQRQERVEQPPAVAADLMERALAIVVNYPDVLPAIEVQLTKTLALVPSTPYLELAQRALAGQALTDDERKGLDLGAEERLAIYGEIELTPSWAVTELTLMFQRIRSDAFASEKQRLADAISRAQAVGDKAQVHALFAELQNLL